MSGSITMSMVMIGMMWGSQAIAFVGFWVQLGGVLFRMLPMGAFTLVLIFGSFEFGLEKVLELVFELSILRCWISLNIGQPR